MPKAFLMLVVVAGCATAAGVETTSKPPPPPPELQRLSDPAQAPPVAIRPTPETASFRPIFERALGRAGFRVLPQPEGRCLTVNLNGDGASTSGANAMGSKVQQALSMEIAVFVEGRLTSEHRSDVAYTMFYETDSRTETLQQFYQRVAGAQRGAFEYIASDLTNKLIGSLKAAP